MEEKTRDLFISAINAAFGINVASVQMSDSDVQSLMRVASRQSIQYIVITGIKKLGYDNLLTEDAEKRIAKASFDYIQRREALKEISQALDADSIDYIPLKGAVLRNLYPNPCMRSSSDIDVLVRQGDLVPAIDALEERTSFKYYMSGHHDVHLKNQRMHLELHFSLLANLEKMDGVLEKAWDYVENNNNSCCYTFSPEYHMFYITAHATKHFIREGGIGIRPMLDLWLLRTKTEYDEQQVRALCEEAGILGYYEMCCNLLAVWFDNASHTEATKEFEDLVLQGGVFASKHSQIVARGRKNTGARYMFNRVIRSKKDIKAMFPVCNKHPGLVPLYQVVRWTHLLNSKKREETRAEIKAVRMLDPKEVEKYDKLMKQMGL